MQYLNAIKAVGSDDPDKLVAYLDGRKFSDFYAHNGVWRGRDHRVLHDMYVVQILSKDEIKEPHAWFKVLAVIPGEQAFRPEADSKCAKDW
jgi:branched-chain amino acid transport system substrate-binding protein